MNKLIFMVLIPALCACSRNDEKTPHLHSVYVTETQGESVFHSRTYAAVVQEDATVSIGFKTAGQIMRILVKEGAHVQPGQLLAELDDADYKLGVEALQIQYDQVRQEVERARKLMEKKSMSANDFEKAEAGLKQLAVQLQVNKNKLAYTRLYAPASGIIESVNFSKGEMVDAGTAVFTMICTDKLEVICDIPANTYHERAHFAGFECRTTSDQPHESFPLTLMSIVPKADGNQLYRMRLCFDGKQPRDLTAGMNVELTIRFATDGEGNDVKIPLSAVFRHDNKECVWVLEADSTVRRTTIHLDPVPDGAMVRVKSGLDAGQKVVRAGASALQEGEKVRVISEPAETNVGGLL